MVAVKKHYISKNTTKQEFTNAMQNWIKNPTQENVKMYGAVKKFGLMPKQDFPEETIKQIADYIFDNDIEQPNWFKKHYEEEQKKGKHKREQETNNKEVSVAEKGVKYALSTKAVLGKNLMIKIKKEGTLKALQFCNENAIPLTDSMSVIKKSTIKRVSNKPRNLKNRVSKKEIEYINIYKEDALNNKESEPIVEDFGNSVKVYYPIKTNSMCLQCHGAPTSQITPKTFALINKKYPKEKAVGYDINQIRGIWSVSFQK